MVKQLPQLYKFDLGKLSKDRKVRGAFTVIVHITEQSRTPIVAVTPTVLPRCLRRP